jgi:hypothetical protein
VAERVAMRAGLREAGDVVIGEFQSARQRAPMARAETRLVRYDKMARRPTSGKYGIASGVGHRGPQGEDAPVADRRQTGSHLVGGQIIESADLVVGSPMPPLGRRAFQ